MSNSEDENENFCYFGKPLDPYDEDAVPRKKPITVEEQIATDAQGRRRFHGAFTGGFSAGFFNTVGSLEGWTPSGFKSSRSEKSEVFSQKPQDFMDDEDLGEDGIAPQVVRATNDYNTSKKRKKQVFSEGPIPGEPVLHNILTSGNETIGYMLLKNLRIRDKKKENNQSNTEKTYGCQMPKTEDFIELSGDNQYEIPEIYKEFLAKPKTNTFGLGYVGLDKDRFSLFPSENLPKFIVTDKNNKKLSISGQAFGVGAFENEDDDIYKREDMSKYDFELVGEKEKASKKNVGNELVFDMFMRSKITPVLKNNSVFPPPQIPHSFTGKHKIKRSRFEPIIPPKEEDESSSNKVNPMIRAKYLGEESDKEHTKSKSLKDTISKSKVASVKESTNPTTQSSFDVGSLLSDRFVSSSKKEDVNNILESVEKTETIHGTEQMRAAVKMKMFGPLTRTTTDWVPHALLCKRFNVPEPFVDHQERSRTRTKNIIFEYQKHVEEDILPPGIKKENTDSFTADNDDNINKLEENNLENMEIKIEPSKEVQIQPKDITDRIDLEQQQDLFKAVFMSSESESENEKETEKIKEEESISDETKEEWKNIALSDELIPKIKPLREGVLSGINFHKFVRPTPKLPEAESKEAIEHDEKLDDNDGYYGPKVPERVSTQLSSSTVNNICSESDDEWVEKDGDKKKKKHKKEKKRKKEKHRKHRHHKKEKSVD